ncbi:phosphonate C-P lyase system protein PhnG (plasmid) [Photobacterium sp. DA100]|uniref:phosphonate C-P lyase system protein PhnG n=1 Tax=Photobacterium sp. DA100 TaxID=3027472 RepID=UPI002479AAA0|nr:phosphonate C-P lyase system protein PhnG [Photobacterium sp. DA100]WEM44150.1 phosphonate C-P lyase system protein PhnG [Photobacterium sp. DA100]
MDTTEKRKYWMSVLAQASFEKLSVFWQQSQTKYGLAPDYQVIRPAEIGLAQVRARMGSTGRQFNIGDVTITRAAIQLATGEMGYSYLQGRNKQHAELAAILDALLQTESYQKVIFCQIIAPLATDMQAERALRQQEVASSKVDFFTMVRGED